MTNEMHISLAIGLAQSESLNIVLFYICIMQNTYNPKPNYIINLVYVYKSCFDIQSTLCIFQTLLSTGLSQYV